MESSGERHEGAKQYEENERQRSTGARTTTGSYSPHIQIEEQEGAKTVIRKEHKEDYRRKRNKANNEENAKEHLTGPTSENENMEGSDEQGEQAANIRDIRQKTKAVLKCIEIAHLDPTKKTPTIFDKSDPPVGSRGYLLSAHVGGVIAVDVVGPLTIREQTVHFLSIIDHFSRYPHAVQLNAVTSQAICEALYCEWISYFSTPAYLLSDNAPVFKSAELLKELSSCGIKSLYPFPYHPEGNGIIESFHLFFKRALVATLRLSDLSIKVILLDLLMAYRATSHISTGESPYYLMTGMDLILPRMQDWAGNFVVDFGKPREEVLRHLHKAAFDSTARRAVTRAAMKPGTTKSKPLKEGTLVLYWLNPGDKRQIESKVGTTKTMPLWSGPYRVLRKSATREDLYVIRQIWNRGKPRTVARELLMEIPGVWGDSEAQEALKELIADLKRPRRDQPIGTTTEDIKTESRRANADLEERGRQLLQELTATSTPTTPDAQSSKALEGRAKESPTASSSSSSRKRLRTAQCMNWVELIRMCR